MVNKKLHIVAFNIPFPADYGGVIDVFYKLKNLSEQGIEITLHTFEYGRKQSEELEYYCKKVFYYSRRIGWRSQLSFTPYIIYSRRNADLLKNLQEDQAPILFEGLHTCYYLAHPALKNRMKWVRTHNIEHIYYRGLAANSDSICNKIYFRIEAFRLQYFEQKLRHADLLLCLSKTEKIYFERLFGKEKTIFLPLFFQSEEKTNEIIATKPYVLYHGDLSSPENTNAALFLMRNLAPLDTTVQWIIAGKNPNNILLQETQKHPNINLCADLNAEEMKQLISNAGVNLLYTNQVSGVKLKLLNALHWGGHCIANRAMLAGSGLEEICEIMPEDLNEIIRSIQYCFSHPFSEEKRKLREEKMNQIYNNQSNAQVLIAQL